MLVSSGECENYEDIEMASKQKIDETKIDDLINEIGQEFEQLKNLPETAEVVVPDSIPILWFGDLEAYEKSDLRVLTVSKNPSDAEFGENQRFKNLSALTERVGRRIVNRSAITFPLHFNNILRNIKTQEGAYKFLN